MELGNFALASMGLIATGIGSYLAATSRSNTKMKLEIQHLEDTKAAKNGVTDSINEIKLDMKGMSSSIETIESKVSSLFVLFNEHFTKRGN